MRNYAAIALGFVASAAILTGCGDKVDGSARAGDETSTSASSTTKSPTRTSAPKTSAPRTSAPRSTTAAKPPAPFTIGALETKLASTVKAQSVTCVGPTEPKSGDQFDCVAVIAEGDLPIKVTLTDAAGQKYVYDGKANFGATTKSVSGNFALK